MNCRKMNKYIFSAALRNDKSPSLCIIEPFYFTCSHNLLSPCVQKLQLVIRTRDPLFEWSIEASTAVATSCLFFNASNSLCSNNDALKNKQLVATAVEAFISLNNNSTHLRL